MADTVIDTTAETDPWRTRPAVGRQIGATANAVQRLIEAGLLYPAYRIGGRVLVRQSAVDAFIERSRIEPHRAAATA